MKIIYELDDEKDDRETIEMMAKVFEIHSACRDADNRLRSYEKYEDSTLERAEKAIEEARTILNNVLW